MLWTDAARLAVGASVLTFGAWVDLRWRRAPDAAWQIAAIAGFVLLLADWALDRQRVADAAPILAVSGLIAVLALVSFRFGLLMGGADAKALAAFAVLGALPLDPAFDVPLVSAFPLVLSMLGNALVLVPLIPIGFFAFNFVRRDVAFPLALVGYRRATANLDDAHVWPLEWVRDDGTLGRSASPNRVPYERSRERVFGDANIERVWVTPKLPFLVPLAFGFAATFFIGDVLGTLVGLVVG